MRKQKRKKVRIYPAFDALYYSFYIQGIFDTFGLFNVEFSYRGFPRLPLNCLAFIVEGDPKTKVVIDAYDGAKLTDYAGLEWCDVYGKVNLISALIPEHCLYKCLPIGPSFPIWIWPWAKTYWMALKHYRANVQGFKSAREHLANYVRQSRDRLPLSHFVPGDTRENYVFFSSTIWTEEEAPGTTQCRAFFMETCKSLNGIDFEGGFSPGRNVESAKRYEELIAPKRFPFSEWLEKTQLSTVVFNTPAVCLSHTWKLAEFLALGKAIISTAISRELPGPLVHQEHIHYVDGSPESFREALESILTDSDYRMYLETNAYKYYVAFLAPHRVIQRVLQHRGYDGQSLRPKSKTVERLTGEIDSRSIRETRV